MDRGKGIRYETSLDTRTINARNVSSGNVAARKAASRNIGQLECISTSVEDEFYRLLHFRENERLTTLKAKTDFLSGRESCGSLVSPTFFSNTLIRASWNDQPFSEEPIFKRLFENTLTAEYLECNGAIVVCNRRFGELFQRSTNNIIGKEAASLLGIDSASLVFKCNEYGDEKESEQAEFVVKVNANNDNVRWLSCSITRFVWDRLRLEFGSVIDISDKVADARALTAAKAKIQNLSLQLINAQEIERKRVALELHDGISQSLSAIKLNIEQYIAVVSKPKSCEVEVEDNSAWLGSKLVHNIQNTIEEIRRISVDLSPSMLDDLGLVLTIQWFCREFQSAYRHITIKKHIAISEEKIPTALKIVIYRILQESLNNASKHSNAEQVYIEIAAVPKGIRFCVWDNGEGFKEKCNTVPNPKIGGMGLKSMQERAQSTGALFKVRSISGQGVGVHVLWPNLQVEKLRR